MRNFPGPFRSPRMLKHKEKPFPLLLTPVLPPLPFPSLRRPPADIELGAFSRKI